MKGRYGLTWTVCQIGRVIGYLFIALGIYLFLPRVPELGWIPGTEWDPWGGIAGLAAGVLIIMSAESWLVIFQTERNTAQMLSTLRRIETILEYESAKREARRESAREAS